MRDDEAFVHAELAKAGGLPQINAAGKLIKEYLKGSYYPSKDARLAQWNPADRDIYDLIVSIFTVTLTNDYLTYQALMGALNNKLPHESTTDRVKTLAEIVACIAKADLIDIKGTRGEYFLISPTLILKGIPFVDNHGTVYDRPQPVEANWDTNQGSMLLGGRLNHHEDNVCLDHINRMNRIPLALNKEFLLKYKEDPKQEKAVDTYEKKMLWNQYTHNGRRRYADMLTRTNKAYLNHKYCTRGRTYAIGYYINSQGSSFKKACLQLANKEYLNKR